MTKPNLGKQRTVTGSYSGQSVERNTSKTLGDVACDFTTTPDKVRDAGGGSDYNSLPSDRPNYYTGPDGFKLGKRLTHPDIDPDGSRALQKDWHRKGGFSAQVNTYDNHPSKGTTNMKSRGTDTASPGQGSPAKAILPRELWVQPVAAELDDTELTQVIDALRQRVLEAREERALDAASQMKLVEHVG